jgi:hypothetical protein
VTLVKDGKYDRVTHVLQVRPEHGDDIDPPARQPLPDDVRDNAFIDDDLPF